MSDDCPLSHRELEILALVGGGFTNDYIGRALCLSPNTIKTHLNRIARRLQTRDRTHAVTTAIELGLLETDTDAELGAVVRVVAADE